MWPIKIERVLKKNRTRFERDVLQNVCNKFSFDHEFDYLDYGTINWNIHFEAQFDIIYLFI